MTDAAVDQSAPPLLVFVHIPKTAGTTLTTVLRMNEPGERIRRLSNMFKGGGGLDEGYIERLRERKSPLDLGHAAVLTAHIPLGIREYLPEYVAKGREVRYFTFLREPIDRSLSHYFAIREQRAGSAQQPKFARSPLPEEPTLDDMLEGGHIHDNLHTRMLSGLPEPFGEVSEEMLEQAKRNLREGLVFFGLTERFDESLVLAKQRLGLRSILAKPSGHSRQRSRSRASGRVNITRPRGDEVPGELIEAAERCNRYDIELYRYADELFDSTPERGGLEFEVELTALRAAEAEGEIQLDAPPPEGFAGDEQAWRMLLHARASLLRREFQLAELKALQDGTFRRKAGGRKTHTRRAMRKAGRPKSGARREATSRPKVARAKKARRRQAPTSVAPAGPKRGKGRRMSEESRPTGP
jgi:hypothetical protein